MNNIKFYKGESISLIFSAYDKDKNPVDISEYEKKVSVFTAFSTPLVKGVTDTGNNTFRVDITSDETSSIEYADSGFNIVVSLKKGDEVKIGKSIPCILLDPNSSGCGESNSLSIDSGSLKVDMNFDPDVISFDLYMGNTITNPIIRTDEFRREICFIMQTEIQKVPIMYDMIINKIKTRNVSKLFIRQDEMSEWQEMVLNSDIDIQINGNYDLYVRIEKLLTDSEASISIRTTSLE